MSKAVIREVIDMAMRAPSSLNTQPWNFYVVAGEPLDRIRAGNTERNLAGVPSSRKFRGHGEYAGAHRERQSGMTRKSARSGCCAGFGSSTRRSRWW